MGDFSGVTVYVRNNPMKGATPAFAVKGPVDQTAALQQ